MRRLILWLPLGLFLLFLVVAAVRLREPSDQAVPSRLVGKPLPDFQLPAAIPAKPGIESADYRQGQPRILNIFASWCIPCMAEAPQLTALARRGLPIDAIAVRDRPEDIEAFLERWGDPYARIGADATSQVQIALGSAGVPETFVIDGSGIIRHQHIGEIRPEHVDGIVRAWRAAQ